jgi:hypothetical protein
MKYILITLAFYVLCSCSTSPKINEIDFTSGWDTIRVLENPHKGWYHHLLDNGVTKYAISNDSIFQTFPGMDHLYLRLAWSYLEPEEGRFDWSRIDEVVEKYVPLGYKISFRITSKETGKYPNSVGQQLTGIQYATPVWVQKAGAKGVVSEVWGTRSWTPDWDDPVFLEKLNNFHRAFAERYDGQNWLSYIDIGSIGEWGEGHTSFSTKIPPTVAEVKANIDIFLKNYKKSQLVVTDDLIYYGKSNNDEKTLYDYAITNGITLRDDSPLVDWYMQQNLAAWSVSHPHFYDPLYLKKPVIFELQHYGEVKKDGNWRGKNGSEKIEKYGYSGAEVMRNAIKTMHATYIGYHGYAEEWLADNPDLTNELANLCGYWYFPVEASFPSVLKKGTNQISITWINKGVAPAYHSFDLILRLESLNNNKLIDLEPIESNNQEWLPEKTKSENYIFELPADANKGQFLLKFKLIDQSAKTTRIIQTGLKDSFIDENDFAELGKIELK